MPIPPLPAAIAMLVLLASSAAAETVTRPQVGAAAPAATFTLADGGTVQLATLTAAHPVVLVVLRGWPGYQCPICTRQVNELFANASAFAERKAEVVLVYPGPAERLGEHAKEFLALAKGGMPPGFRLVLDPALATTTAWGLRWDAPKETAYPSTFVIGSDGVVRFAHISDGHGDRTPAKTALDAVAALPAAAATAAATP